MDRELVRDYKKYFKSLYDYMVEKGFTCKPVPKVILRDEEQDCPDIFARTGHFDPSLNAIVIYVRGRHIKDCARTFAHELIHWKQQCEGEIEKSGYSSDKITEDKNLIHLEAEAYLKGNMAFRSWTEFESKKGN